MKELNARLKSGKLDRLYVFYGVETYLIRAYEKRLISAIFADSPAEMNTSLFQGSGIEVQDIISAAETLPFLADKRLVILKNTGFLQAGKKEASDALAAYMEKLPEHTIILFTETEKPPDKRGKLFKAVSGRGFAVDFATPPEAELAAWLVKVLAQESVSIDKGTSISLCRYVCGGASENGIMENLHMEALKLAAYKGAGGIAAIADIEQICTQSIEGKVFTLVKEIGTKNMHALTTLSNLLMLKEPPLMLLSMFARQFRYLLICKSLRAKGVSSSEIAKMAGLRDFMVTDFLKQGANFTEEILTKTLENALDAEYSIKSGKMTDRFAIEQLIVKTVMS